MAPGGAKLILTPMVSAPKPTSYRDTSFFPFSNTILDCTVPVRTSSTRSGCTVKVVVVPSIPVTSDSS